MVLFSSIFLLFFITNSVKTEVTPVQSTWKTRNFLLPELDEDTVAKVEDLIVLNKDQEIKTSNNRRLFYQEAWPTSANAKGHVLLLHDELVTSWFWRAKDTIQTLAAFGFHAFAVDIPGSGRSSGKCEGSVCLENIIEELKLNKPLLVSPKIAANMSLQLIIKNPDALSGFLTVAPVGARELEETILGRIGLPTLSLRGEWDIYSGKERTEKLEVMPNAQIVVFPKSNSRVYDIWPNKFNRLLVNFARKVFS